MIDSMLNTVLITGASMGIGLEMARDLASRCKHLILVARSADALEALAEELRAAHGVQVTVIALDLGVPGAAQALYARTQALQVDALINNAGFGLKGGFVDLPLDDQQRMLQLNIQTLTDLCHLYGKDMAARGHGRIQNVASVAAFQPGPNMAVYCATKAYVLSFSEALDAELRARGVRVSALCPGAVDTAFHAVAKTDSKVMQAMAMAPQPVARAGVQALLSGRRIVIPGVMNWLMVFFVRWMPRCAVTTVAGRVIGR